MRVWLNWFRIPGDLFCFLCLGLRSRSSLAAENLFLRKQLAFYQERKVKPRRADDLTRLTLVLLGRRFNWRDALTIVRPRTFVTWHRKGFRLFWRWKSAAGRRPIPAELQHLIRRMARETRGARNGSPTSCC
jgi:putative transposase